MYELLGVDRDSGDRVICSPPVVVCNCCHGKGTMPLSQDLFRTWSRLGSKPLLVSELVETELGSTAINNRLVTLERLGLAKRAGKVGKWVMWVQAANDLSAAAEENMSGETDILTTANPDAAQRGCGLADANGSSAAVLDACCGSRMFWFNRSDERAVFMDIRSESHALPDVSSKGGVRLLEVRPDVIGDFRNIPCEDGRFSMVVFDPPHLVRAGKKGWQAKKYGKLEGDWRAMLRDGFRECFRVLKPEGTLIFKWNEHEVPVSQILELTPERTLIGQRCGKTAKTHWLVFMKLRAAEDSRELPNV